mgnify:CR=1 FL=1
MTDSTNKPNVLFWIVGVIAIIWNGMGVNAYVQQAYDTEGHRAQFVDKPELLELTNNMPSWYTAIFAIAVFAGILGCVFMLLRKKLANFLLKVSLAAVLIQTINNLFFTGVREFYGTFEYSMLISIAVIAIFLVVYTKKATEKGWLS